MPTRSRRNSACCGARASPSPAFEARQPIMGLMCCLAAAWLAIGPHLDPIDGECIDANDRAVLPSARHLGDLVDMWMPHMVSQAAGGQGIDTFDPLAVTAHGWGRAQMTFAWGAVDMTDPARPGEPLLSMPHDAWDTLSFVSLWAPAPRLAYHGAATAPGMRTQLSGAWSGAVGGGVWLPRHVFDREPAFAWGAPRLRRRLKEAHELVAQIEGLTALGPVQVFYEHLAHDHRYLTLAAPDLAERHTFLWVGRLDVTPWPIDVRVGFQDVSRDHDGAQYRWTDPLTRQSRGQTWLWQAETHRTFTSPAAFWARGLDAALGLGFRQDTATLAQPTAWLTDVADAWLWMARPTLPSRLRRWHGHGCAGLTLGPADAPVKIVLDGHLAAYGESPDLLGGSFGQTYAGRAATMTQWRGPPVGRHAGGWLHHWRVGADWRVPWRAAALDLDAALDVSAIRVAAGGGLARLGPAAGVALRLPRRYGEWFGLVRHEPQAFTAEAVRFLDPYAPESVSRVWHDANGDGVPEADEAGMVLRYGGGPWHRLGAGVVRPKATSLVMGYRSPWWHAWQGIIYLVGRGLQDRLTVDVPGRLGQSPVPYHDPGGDGRGEQQAPGGGQNFTVYAEDPATTAALGYVLVNARGLATYAGIETGLYSDPNRPWFANLAGAAYLSAGAAPFGNFADRNDPGAIDEASAGANHELNADGRYEHDRAFSLKLMAGLRPLPGMSLALVGRYRDGEPMARIAVVPGLPQGPTPIMAIRRGRARATFAMRWDVRLRYALVAARGYAFTLSVDVYNLLGSATELLEDVRTGPTYRQALEAVPGRAIWVQLAVCQNGASTPSSPGL